MSLHLRRDRPGFACRLCVGWGLGPESPSKSPVIRSVLWGPRRTVHGKVTCAALGKPGSEMSRVPWISAPGSNYASSSLPEWEKSVETITRRPKNLASIEYAPGPRKAYEEVDSRTIPTSGALMPRRCVRSSRTANTAKAQTAGVSRPRQSKLSKARKARCFQPVGKAMPAKAQAMQPRRTSRAAPGAPPGNIEKSLCTT